MKFTKMQGLGNDYVYVDCAREKIMDPAGLSRRISDRHFGIGSDGLVMILPGDEADFRMRMFNADGSEAEMCGNAIRCVGRYVYERGLTDRTEIGVETCAGLRKLKMNLLDGKVSSVQVDMGVPEFLPERIPADPARLGLPADAEAIAEVPLALPFGTFSVTCVSMGNPHCVIFTDEVESLPLEVLGPAIERHPAFPQKTNVEFARVIDRGQIRMRVWERGSGETMACGTGACATLAAAVKTGRTDRKATLHLNGGDLEIEWNEKTGRILKTGPAVFVFDGDIEV